MPLIDLIGYLLCPATIISTLLGIGLVLWFLIKIRKEKAAQKYRVAVSQIQCPRCRRRGVVQMRYRKISTERVENKSSSSHYNGAYFELKRKGLIDENEPRDFPEFDTYTTFQYQDQCTACGWVGNTRESTIKGNEEPEEHIDNWVDGHPQLR